MPLWLRRALARLPPLPRKPGPLDLTSYLIEFAGPDDGPHVTWKPEPNPRGSAPNERNL